MEYLRTDSILFHLAGQEEGSSDLQFLHVRVPGDVDHFHPVSESRWNGIGEVPRSDEHHPGEVKGDV